MASRSEIAAVYGAGTVQGIALVTFPAASTIFTSPSYYDLSSSAYGGMFVPQAIAAIAAALLGASYAKRYGGKRVLLVGLSADLLSMLILLASRTVMDNRTLAYGMLLTATACLGLGFGLTVPVLNSFAAFFFPRAIDRAVLLLNALLGLGTVLAPLFVAVFVALGYWQGLPMLVAVLVGGLILFSSRLPLKTATAAPAIAAEVTASIPRRFWAFAAFALLYGFVETMSGNWASLYMKEEMTASTTQASLALTAFWGMVTLGRVSFALIEKWLPERATYRALPFIAAAAFFILSALAVDSAWPAIAAFALAGLGCSALLPLTISFGQKELTVFAASVAGGLIAFYQVGYGLGAFGVGPLERATGWDLSQVYGWSTLVALVMAVVAFVVSKGRAAAATAGTEPKQRPGPRSRAA